MKAKFLKHFRCAYFYPSTRTLVIWHEKGYLTDPMRQEWYSVHKLGQYPYISERAFGDLPLVCIGITSLGVLKLFLKARRANAWYNNATDASTQRGMPIRSLYLDMENSTDSEYIGFHDIPNLLGGDFFFNTDPTRYPVVDYNDVSTCRAVFRAYPIVGDDESKEA